MEKEVSPLAVEMTRKAVKAAIDRSKALKPGLNRSHPNYPENKPITLARPWHREVLVQGGEHLTRRFQKNLRSSSKKERRAARRGTKR